MAVTLAFPMVRDLISLTLRCTWGSFHTRLMADLASITEVVWAVLPVGRAE